MVNSEDYIEKKQLITLKEYRKHIKNCCSRYMKVQHLGLKMISVQVS